MLDTGCVESVGADIWVNNFINFLHPSTRKLIKVESSNRVFKFGGGEKRPSLGTFHIPCSIEGQNIILSVDAVKQPVLGIPPGCPEDLLGECERMAWLPGQRI